MPSALSALPWAGRLVMAATVLMATAQAESNLPRGVGTLLSGIGIAGFLATRRGWGLLSVVSVCLGLQVLCVFYLESAFHSYFPFLVLASLLALPSRARTDDLDLDLSWYEREVRRLFWKHDPQKAHLVDQLLLDNRGKELAFLRSLRKEYGEADDTVKDLLLHGAKDADDEDNPSTSKVYADIRALVRQRDAQHIHLLDNVLSRYKGRERELMAQLCRDYRVALPRYCLAEEGRGERGEYKPWVVKDDKVLEEERLRAREAVERNLLSVQARGR